MPSFGDMIAQAFNQQPDPGLVKQLAPWEDSPGKGSRDVLMQDATGWGRENLGAYLQQNQGDPYGVFDAGAVSRYLATGTPGTPGVPGEGGWDAQPAQGYGQFSEFTTPQLQAYLTKMRSGPVNPSDPWSAAMWNMAQKNNDLMWMPEYRDVNGQPMVSWGKKNNKEGGLWDTITSGEWINNVAAGAVLGLGAADIFSQLGGNLPGLSDSPWGVNPQQGASMFDEAGFLDFGSTGTGNSFSLSDIFGAQDAFGADPTTGGFANLGNGLLNSVSGMQQLGMSPTQILQSFGVNGSNLVGPAKTALQKILGGQGQAQDWMSILGSLGATGLGVLGSNQASDAYERIANQSRADRQPFLDKSLEWMRNPKAFGEGPGASTLEAVLANLSMNGNPANDPRMLGVATDAGLRNWQNAVTGFGNIGLAGQDSRNALLSNAAAADRGVTTSLASGLGSLTQPDNSLESMLRRLQTVGLA